MGTLRLGFQVRPNLVVVRLGVGTGGVMVVEVIEETKVVKLVNFIKDGF